MQIAITISHTFETPDMLALFAERVKALFAEFSAVHVEAPRPAPAPDKQAAVAANPSLGAAQRVGEPASPSVPPVSVLGDATTSVPVVEGDKPAKRGRGRPRVAKPEAVFSGGKPASAPVVEAVSAHDDSVPALADPTLNDMRIAFMDVVDLEGGEEKIKDVLLHYKVARMQEIPTEKYPEVHAKLVRIRRELEAAAQ